MSFDSQVHFIADAQELGLRLIEECVRALELPAGAVTSKSIDDVENLATDTDIFGSRELGQLLGISRQRLLQLRGAGVVPAPNVELAATPVWRLATVVKFVWEWCRRSGPRPKSDIGAPRGGIGSRGSAASRSPDHVCYASARS